MSKLIYGYEQLAGFAQRINQQVQRGNEALTGLARGKVYGIPRGGASAALLLACVSKGNWHPTERIEEADLILDDIIDSGATMKREALRTPGRAVHKAALISKIEPTEASGLDFFYGAHVSPENWVVFPWEGSETASADDICTRLLQFIGEDPKREGLRETPARFIKAWSAWCDGYKAKPADVLKVFEDGGERYDQMLMQRDIPIYSHCEHHLAPFFGVAHVAYIPDGRIVGLSKLSRLVDIFAHRLQVQERLTVQIADALQATLKPRGVAVVLECRHLCMESRGVERQGALTTTSSLHGLLRESAVRAEFFSLLKR